MLEAASISEASINIYRKAMRSIQEHSLIYIYIYIYRGCKKCVHILRDSQAVDRPNQKCLDADGNHLEHLL